MVATNCGAQSLCSTGLPAIWAKGPTRSAGTAHPPDTSQPLGCWAALAAGGLLSPREHLCTPRRWLQSPLAGWQWFPAWVPAYQLVAGRLLHAVGGTASPRTGTVGALGLS